MKSPEILKGGVARHPPVVRQKVTSPHCMMSKADENFQHYLKAHDDLLYFSLPSLLADRQTLVVNPAMRTAMLFWKDSEGGIHILSQQQFSPNGMRVLVPLLQAYPEYCPYDILLLSLFPLPLEAIHTLLAEDGETTIRPVRRAMSSILAPLRAFGLSVTSVRGAGYLLIPLSH